MIGLARLSGVDASDDQMVLVERGAQMHELADLRDRARIGERPDEAQHHPASCTGLQVERSAGHDRQTEPRNGIAENDVTALCCRVAHGVLAPKSTHLWR